MEGSSNNKQPPSLGMALFDETVLVQTDSTTSQHLRLRILSGRLRSSADHVRYYRESFDRSRDRRESYSITPYLYFEKEYFNIY